MGSRIAIIFNGELTNNMKHKKKIRVISVVRKLAIYLVVYMCVGISAHIVIGTTKRRRKKSAS